MNPYSSQQGAFFAHKVTLEGVGEDALAQSLSTARVDMNPHQVDAALFALSSPLAKGVLLADEVGLGKTIEAALVIAQKWAERRRRILLIVPASLRKQWSQELADKFSLPSTILEAKVYNETRKQGRTMLSRMQLIGSMCGWSLFIKYISNVDGERIFAVAEASD
jgi:N12 class adenine-specific DNA methylase